MKYSKLLEMKIHLLLQIVFFISIGCKNNCHHDITFINNSNKNLYYYEGSYPDTSIFDYNPLITNYYFIPKNTHSRFQISSCFEQRFNLTPKIIYFIFDAEVLKTIPWDTVMKKYMILKRYELTLQGLKDSNWTITYH